MRKIENFEIVKELFYFEFKQIFSDAENNSQYYFHPINETIIFIDRELPESDDEFFLENNDVDYFCVNDILLFSFDKNTWYGDLLENYIEVFNRVIFMKQPVYISDLFFNFYYELEQCIATRILDLLDNYCYTRVVKNIFPYEKIWRENPNLKSLIAIKFNKGLETNRGRSLSGNVNEREPFEFFLLKENYLDFEINQLADNLLNEYGNVHVMSDKDFNKPMSMIDNIANSNIKYSILGLEFNDDAVIFNDYQTFCKYIISTYKSKAKEIVQLLNNQINTEGFTLDNMFSLLVNCYFDYAESYYMEIKKYLSPSLFAFLDDDISTLTAYITEKSYIGEIFVEIEKIKREIEESNSSYQDNLNGIRDSDSPVVGGGFGLGGFIKGSLTAALLNTALKAGAHASNITSSTLEMRKIAKKVDKYRCIFESEEYFTLVLEYDLIQFPYKLLDYILACSTGCVSENKKLYFESMVNFDDFNLLNILNSSDSFPIKRKGISDRYKDIVFKYYKEDIFGVDVTFPQEHYLTYKKIVDEREKYMHAPISRQDFEKIFKANPSYPIVYELYYKVFNSFPNDMREAAELFGIDLQQIEAMNVINSTNIHNDYHNSSTELADPRIQQEESQLKNEFNNDTNEIKEYVASAFAEFDKNDVILSIHQVLSDHRLGLGEFVVSPLNNKYSKMIRGASSKYFVPQKQEEVLFIFDNTVFGGCKDGAVITDKNIHIHNMWQPCQIIPIDKIKYLKKNENKIDISFYYDTANGNIDSLLLETTAHKNEYDNFYAFLENYILKINDEVEPNNCENNKAIEKTKRTNNDSIMSPANNQNDFVKKIERLAILRDKSLITEEEYTKKKNEILGSI